MSYLIRIDQAEHMPVFVRRLHRRCGLLVTFKPGEARRFAAQDEARLVMVRVAAAEWARPETVAYVPAGL
jgi:hypothetical protein